MQATTTQPGTSTRYTWQVQVYRRKLWHPNGEPVLYTHPVTGKLVQRRVPVRMAYLQCGTMPTVRVWVRCKQGQLVAYSVSTRSTTTTVQWLPRTSLYTLYPNAVPSKYTRVGLATGTTAQGLAQWLARCIGTRHAKRVVHQLQQDPA